MIRRYIQPECLEHKCAETIVVDVLGPVYRTAVNLITDAELEAERRKAFEAGAFTQDAIESSEWNGTIASAFADYLKTVEGEE